MYGSSGLWLDGGISNTAWQVWAVLFNGVVSEFWINGLSDASGNAGPSAFSGITVGNWFGGGDNSWNGDIAELLLYDTALSAADRATVETYLNQKWAAY